MASISRSYSNLANPIPLPLLSIENSIKTNNWNAEQIAEDLWQDPTTIISEPMVKKVNNASSYLQEIGFELRGVKADGNCFLNAFLKSYALLSRKIPLLDDTEDKVSYLRGQIAAQYESSPNNAKNPNRAEEIKKDAVWIIASGEGDFLANVLDIPIRVLTVGTNGVNDMLTFTERNKEREEWNTISETDRPLEYIFIVDLEGHFVYAASIQDASSDMAEKFQHFNLHANPQLSSTDSAATCNTDISEMISTKTLLGSKKNASSISLESSVFDEDAYPYGVFIPRLPCLVINFDPNTNEIEVKMALEDTQRLHLRLCEYFVDDPALLLGMVDQFSIPKADAARFGIQALEQLIESGKGEIQKAISQQSNSLASRNSKIDDEKIPTLIKAKSSLEEKKIKLEEEKKLLTTEWDQTVKNYYQKSFKLLVKDADENEQEQFFTLFHKLRDLNPSSFIPFYPILTTLISRFEKESLKSWVKEAKKCDAYHTYALIVHFLRLSLTYPSSHVDNVEEILEVLKDIYPEDLMIPALIEGVSSESKEAKINFSQVADSLEHALNNLALNDPHSAIEQLARSTPALVGYALLHRYLALAWIFKGCFKQAKDIMKRSSLLFDIHGNCPMELMWKITNMLRLMIPKSSITPKKPPEVKLNQLPDPLEAFIKMSEKQPLDIALAKAFIDESIKGLKRDINHLPVVYFGIRNLTAQLVIKLDQFDNIYSTLFSSLGELISITLWICHRTDVLDPWIADMCEKQESEGRFRFVVKFPSIKFGLNSSQKEELPTFKFSDNLDVAWESISSLAICVTKQAYSLILALISSHIMPAYLIADKSFVLPDDPAIFTQALQTGFITDKESGHKRNDLFSYSVAYLSKYLSIQPVDRPYAISNEILDWAKFCIFSMQPPSFSSNKMEKEILDNYYPQNLSKEEFDKYLLEVNSRTGFLIDEKESSIVSLALRDALLADHHLKVRSLSTPIYITERDNFYSVFKTSQHLFGWRYEESFDEWGNRLRKAEQFGPAASDFNMIEHVDINITRSPSVTPQIEGNLSKPTKEILRTFLQFWLKFHQKTREKNIFILEGGDEDDLKNEYKEREWHQSLDIKKWISIIQNNSPKNYPQFGKLSKEDKFKLEQIVNNKHEHDTQVKNLKIHCKRPGYKNSDEFTIIMAAALITNAEYDRTEAYHSVFMENEGQARRLYQILLNVSLERILRRILVTAGTEGWLVTDTNRVVETLLPSLDHLIGAFHGPETHPSGNGPIQIHYNAGSITSNFNSVNVHIYY